MTAGKAPHAIPVELFVKLTTGFADLLVEDFAEGGHTARPLFYAGSEAEAAASWPTGHRAVEPGERTAQIEQGVWTEEV